MKKAPCFSRRGLSSSGIQLSDRLIRRDYGIAVIRAERQLPGQELFNIESVLLVRIGSQEIVWMLRQIVFLRKERANTSQLQDALAAVQHRQLINGQKIMAKFLIVQGVALLPSPVLAGVVGVDGLFTVLFSTSSCKASSPSSPDRPSFCGPHYSGGSCPALLQPPSRQRSCYSSSSNLSSLISSVRSITEKQNCPILTRCIRSSISRQVFAISSELISL